MHYCSICETWELFSLTLYLFKKRNIQLFRCKAKASDSNFRKPIDQRNSKEKQSSRFAQTKTMFCLYLK